MYLTYFKIKLFAILLLYQSSLMVFGQVTIGADLEANEGALLDLKQFTPDLDNATSRRGLLMPRVALSSLNSLSPVVGNAIEHVGLLVYNTQENDVEKLCKGMHVWDGEEWHLLGSKDVPTVSDHEGNVYKIGYFGAAGWWMLENMKATSYSDGTPLTKDSPTGSLVLQSYGFPENIESNLTAHPEYGLLYSFSGATRGLDSGTTPDIGSACDPVASTVQGICPAGWVIPSDYDWTVLEQEVIANWTKYSGQSSSTPPIAWSSSWCTFNEASSNNVFYGTHGAILKSPLQVTSFSTGGISNTFCKTGFNALLVGRLAEGGVTEYGDDAYFWTSTKSTSFFRWYRLLRRDTTVTPYEGVKRARVNDSQFYMSVRCKKAN